MRVDDLRRALEAVADDAPPRRSDAQLTMRHGRRLLATRRLAISAVALAVLGGVIGVGFGLSDHRTVIVEPAPATTPTTTTTTPTTTTTTTTTTAPSPYPDFVVAAMTRTVEVDFPTEHFMPSGALVSTADALQAIIGIRTPTADAKGQLVFFFHDHAFVGWDAGREAISVFGLEAAGPRSFKVTYVNFAAADPVIGGSLPPAAITYTWDGRRMAPETTLPLGVYGLNNPSANAIRVKLTG